MLGKIIQPPLFKTPKVSNDSRLFAKTELINFDRNLADAFGVTKTGLKKTSYGILENIFYGMRNIKIPLEMLSVENPGEILLNYSATNYLKMRGAHLDPNIPDDFSELVKYINSHKKGFADLAHEFKEYFDIKQMERLELLEQSVKDDFVKSFLASYKSPFNDFGDPNYYGRDKGVYINIICNELKRSSDEAKKLFA